MEAEIMTASKPAKEAAWIEKLRLDIQEKDADGTEAYIPTLHYDNQSSIDYLQ